MMYGIMSKDPYLLHGFAFHIMPYGLTVGFVNVCFLGSDELGGKRFLLMLHPIPYHFGNGFYGVCLAAVGFLGGELRL